jgi:hypothetical protein
MRSSARDWHRATRGALEPRIESTFSVFVDLIPDGPVS